MKVAKREKVLSNKSMVVQGFWIRLLAFFIDWVILSVIGIVFNLVWRSLLGAELDLQAASGTDPKAGFTAALISIFLLWIAIQTIYFAGLNAAFGGTIGKNSLGLKVTNLSGGKLSFSQNLLRETVGKALSSILFLGFIWIAFDKNKQGWHDKIAKTYVVKK